MKKLYILVLTLLITSVSFGQLINEFQPNPTGGDPAMVDVELKGTPASSFTGFILSIENDGYNGLVDRFAAVSGTFDANGLLVVSIPDLENPSFTLALVDTFTGDNTTDIDPANDGVLDLSTIGTVYDAIGIPDNATDATTMYGTTLGGTDFAYTGDEPQSVFRDGGTGAWYAVNDPAGTDVYDITATVVLGTLFNTDPTTTPTTFGAINPINSATVSVSRNEIEGFSMYPNPVSNGLLNITTLNNQTKNIQIFNILGKQVIGTTITGTTVNVANLNAGVYLIKIEEAGKSVTSKLVIK